MKTFTYRGGPCFQEGDRQTIEAWENRQFETLLAFCKIYRNEEGNLGLGYSLMFEDGWEYGHYHNHLGSLEMKDASLKAFYEVLLHASELKPKKVIIWSENKNFLENLTEENIKRNKKLRDLNASFEKVYISNIDYLKIENLEKLRETVFQSAKTGSQYKSRRSRMRIIPTVSTVEEPKEVTEHRMKQFADLIADMIIQQSRRPIEEKLADAQRELQELETNQEELPDYPAKRKELTEQIEKLKQEQAEREQKLEALRRPKDTPKLSINEILWEENRCHKCRKQIEEEWQYCPNCAADLSKEAYLKT